jgi:hypothetical protein
MKTVYLFFLSLFFLLAGAQIHAYGHVHANTTAPKSLRQLDRTQLHALNIGAGTSDTDAFFVGDEDDDNVSGPKSILALKYAVTLSFSFFFYCLYSAVKNRLPLCSHFSYLSAYKYILQRSLRI